MGKQFGDAVIKFHIIGDDGADRRIGDFFNIAFDNMRHEPRFGLIAGDENQTGGTTIGTGRAHFHQIIKRV